MCNTHWLDVHGYPFGAEGSRCRKKWSIEFCCGECLLLKKDIDFLSKAGYYV